MWWADVDRMFDNASNWCERRKCWVTFDAFKVNTFLWLSFHTTTTHHIVLISDYQIVLDDISIKMSKVLLCSHHHHHHVLERMKTRRDTFTHHKYQISQLNHIVITQWKIERNSNSRTSLLMRGFQKCTWEMFASYWPSSLVLGLQQLKLLLDGADFSFKQYLLLEIFFK